MSNGLTLKFHKILRGGAGIIAKTETVREGLQNFMEIDQDSRTH